MDRHETSMRGDRLGHNLFIALAETAMHLAL